MKHYPVLILSLLFAIAQTAYSEGNEVTTALLGDIASYPERTAPATVISLNEAVISAQVAAVVQEINVRVGDTVEKGGKLVGLACEEFELGEANAAAVLDAVDARIELARLNFERIERLFQSNAVSQGDLDAAVAELTALRADRRGAQASLGVAKINRERCVISSPSHTLVLERLASVGQLAMPGTALVRVLDLSSIEVSAQVYAADAEKLAIDSPARLQVGGRSYSVIVRSVVAAVDSTTRNREVRLSFINEQALPGTAATLVWNDAIPHVEPGLIIERGGRLGVFVHEQGVARFVPLSNAKEGRVNPVPLPLTTQIIVEGHYGLKNGDALILR